MDFKNWEVVIGLEIHAQLKTNTKLFSPDKASWTKTENSHIHPISLALPGTLPTLNETALKMALKAAKAFKGEIKTKSFFARKNYFYPDLPKGYQISQYDQPFCQGGQVDFFLHEKIKTITLERIHIEEDAGRSLHKKGHSLINFNRAGIALLEIVTKPDIRTPIEASACAKAIRRILKYIDICDGNLEEGSLRCDCNISVRTKGKKELGIKVELKNINSFRFIEKALSYEANRQIALLNKDLTIKPETRLYDSSKQQTFAMRSKESASDYRYFPDPDLPPLHFDSEFIKNITLPELPSKKRERFKKEYKLDFKTLEILIEDSLLADYFEKIVQNTKDVQRTSNWLTGEVQALLKEKNQKFCPVSVKDFSSLLILISKGDISNKMAKAIFIEMWDSGKSPEEIIQKKNLKQISSEKILENLISKVLTKYPSQIEAYKGGRTKLFSFFIGQVMKEAKGQANPQKTSNILKQKLEKLCE